MNPVSTLTYSEDAFVERLQSGERAAYAELYDRYGRSLYGIIFMIVKSETDAENLLQDTFVKIWHEIGHYDASKIRLYTWLIVIARRRALDFVRSNYYVEKQVIQTTDTVVSIVGTSPEIQGLDPIGLAGVVGQLDPNLKQIIDLQYFMGHTQQEVADQTGLPLGTVKSRTRAAFLYLRQRLSIQS